MELEIDCLTSKRRLQKVCSYKYQFSAPKYEHLPRLVSQVHMMAGQNERKEKVSDVSDPNQIVETKCNSKLTCT